MTTVFCATLEPAGPVRSTSGQAAQPADGASQTAIVNLDAADPRFRSLVLGHPWRSLFVAAPWLEALRRAYGFELQVAALFRHGQLAAALPFCAIADMRGERVVCLPFCDYTDPLVDDPADLAALVDHLSIGGGTLRLRTLRSTLATAGCGLQTTAAPLWHGVDLDRPLDAIWEGLEGSARQNVRKAQRHGVTVRIGHGIDDVLLFHRMHAHLRKTKYRMLAQPQAFFVALHEAFASEGEVAVAIAELEGEPLAAIFLIEWQDTLYYKFNASFDTRWRPNDLLAWSAIAHGRRRGLAQFDFGLSDADQPGLVRYKRKFATEERVIHQLVRPQAILPAAHHQQAGRTLGALTELFTRPEVPDTITREAGDALYRYFA